MAQIIRGKSLCSLCNNVIAQADPIVSTSQFITDESDPLWPFSDAAFHQECFVAWENREVFVARFNQVACHSVFGNGTYHYMQMDGTVVPRHAEGKQLNGGEAG